MSKEPTVDHEEAMKRLVRFAFSDDDGDPDLSTLPGFKTALEKATRAAAMRAWDEGCKAGGDNQHDVEMAIRTGIRMPPPPVNPYRKGDER